MTAVSGEPAKIATGRWDDTCRALVFLFCRRRPARTRVRDGHEKKGEEGGMASNGRRPIWRSGRAGGEPAHAALSQRSAFSKRARKRKKKKGTRSRGAGLGGAGAPFAAFDQVVGSSSAATRERRAMAASSEHSAANRRPAAPSSLPNANHLTAAAGESARLAVGYSWADSSAAAEKAIRASRGLSNAPSPLVPGPRVVSGAIRAPPPRQDSWDRVVARRRGCLYLGLPGR